MSTAAIEAINADVLRLGGQSVELLQSIREFRKGLLLLGWEFGYARAGAYIHGFLSHSAPLYSTHPAHPLTHPSSFVQPWRMRTRRTVTCRSCVQRAWSKSSCLA